MIAIELIAGGWTILCFVLGYWLGQRHADNWCITLWRISGVTFLFCGP